MYVWSLNVSAVNAWRLRMRVKIYFFFQETVPVSNKTTFHLIFFWIFFFIDHWQEGAVPQLPPRARAGAVWPVRDHAHQEEDKRWPHQRRQIRRHGPLDRPHRVRRQGQRQEAQLQAVRPRREAGQQDASHVREVSCPAPPPLLQGKKFYAFGFIILEYVLEFLNFE
jgi:hypothetical protein